jgi:predicted membrane-bound spermidine synthase
VNPPDPSDDDLTDILSEIRLLIPGTQILVAFLIVLPFNSGFTRVSSIDKTVYVVMFVCAMTSLLLFIAPAAQHRLMRPLRDRAAFKRSVNRQVIIGLVPLSLAITLATFFVISNVVSNLVAGILAGLVGLVIALLWWIIPMRSRRVAQSSG